MATKKRRKHSGPKKRRRVGAAPAYAAVGKHKRRRRVGATKKHRRRRIGASGGGSMMTSLKNYGMMLLGGGIAEVGASMLIGTVKKNGSMPAWMSDEILAAAKVGVGGLTFHMAKNNPFFQGAGIGIGVSGIKTFAHAMMPPDMMGAPDEKTLFITLDKKLPENTGDVWEDAEVVGSSASDSPIIGGHQAYTFGADAPIIAGEYFQE